MNNNPLISVCIAVYNRENFIKAAIESVLEQTYQNFEIIIIDDGSTDNTVSVVNGIQDVRIKLFKNDKNRGVVYTRNRYLDIAQGDYIAILDSDDCWLPNKLEQQITFFNNNLEYGICGTNAIRKYSDSKEDVWKYPSTDVGIRVRLFWGSAMIHSSIILKKSILVENDIKYSVKLKQAEDYDLIRQVMSVSKGYNINETLVIYNVHESQFTSEAKEEQVNESFKVAQRYFFDLGIILTQEQHKAFNKIYTYKFNLCTKELLDLKDIFEKIKKVNDTKNFTSNLLLSNNLKKQWFLACYNSTQNGLKTINIFNSISSDLKMKISLNQKFKLYFKCIIKLNYEKN